MDSLPVTLIVKAPNQQIEDQRINCETSWTIDKLKQHLSEVYPSKPPQHEQKLIYSGQLLTDSLVLKDILRQYEGQDTHTVHLVCTPKHIKMNGRPKQSTPVTENTNGDSAPNNSASYTGNPATSGNVSPENTTQNRQAPQSGLAGDNRVPPSFPDENYQWINVNGQLPQFDYNNFNQYQLQMAWMQQAYMQYMTQYMQLAAGQSLAANAQTIPTSSAPNPAAGNAPPNQPDVARGPPQQQNQNAPAQNGLDNEDRDWLDYFYMFSRALVLLSVVYFYSSPVRFLFVVSLGVALYLYQAGFFLNININNNHMNGTPNGAAEEEQAPTRLMVAWTFITTFFASLIPEVPNINA